MQDSERPSNFWDRDVKFNYVKFSVLAAYGLTRRSSGSGGLQHLREFIINQRFRLLERPCLLVTGRLVKQLIPLNVGRPAEMTINILVFIITFADVVQGKTLSASEQERLERWFWWVFANIVLLVAAAAFRSCLDRRSNGFEDRWENRAPEPSITKERFGNGGR